MTPAERFAGAKLKVIKRLFLALVMASSLPAMGATATRTSSFTYESVTGLLISETVEPDQQQFGLDTTYAYDALGNKISVTVSSPATGLQAISSRTSTTAFDADGQFPVSSTNALGHTETKIHDPYLGAVTSLTGPNGLTTQWQYDDFGRKTREIRADGTQTVWTYEPCDAACPANGAYRIYTQVWAGSVKAAPTSVEYFDQLGRKIRNAVQAFDGRWTYTDTVYDELGRKQKVSRPYFAGGEIHWVTSEFDELDRVVMVYEPDDLENPALVADYDAAHRRPALDNDSGPVSGCIRRRPAHHAPG